MKTILLIYFEMGHSRFQSITTHLKNQIRKIGKAHFKKAAILLETSQRSVQFQALQWFSNGVRERKLLPISYYENFAKTARDYTENQFLRQLEMISALTQHSQTSQILLGIDPRGSKTALKKFRAQDKLYPQLLSQKPRLPRLWLKDKAGPYDGCLAHKSRRLFSKDFLEEQAFCAWFTANTIDKLEAEGVRLFSLSIGALHFPALIRYLSKSNRQFKLFRLPVDSDPIFRKVIPAWDCLENCFLKLSRNPDYASLFNFFLDSAPT